MTMEESDRPGQRDIAGDPRIEERRVRISNDLGSAGSAGIAVGSRHRGLLMSAALFCAAATACASTGDTTGKAEREDGFEQPEAGNIVIKPYSNICVSVAVDQRVWPIPIDPDTARNLSGHLMAELRRLYEQRVGTSFITIPESGSKRQARFATDHNGTNPICRDSDEDIRIIARYGPRPDGTPFVFDYRIEQGAVVRQSFAERDIQAEWRSGRLVRIHKQEPLEVAISEDIWSRASPLLDELLPGE